MLTRDEIERSLPANLKSAATQEFTDQINTIISDPIMAENIRNNFISYTAVLKDGKFKTQDYLNAVVYVSYKLMGNSNGEAYAKTFPSRYAELVAKGTTNKDIAAYVSAYNKGKLVNLILEQCLVPSWVLNADLHQKAINIQAEIMMDEEVSAKVRVEAANSLLTHLKKPEVGKVQLDLSVAENSGLSELNETLSKMAKLQQSLVGGGVELKQIAAAPIIEGEKVENGAS